MTKNENEAKLNETLHESSRGRKVLRFLFEIAKNCHPIEELLLE